MRFLKLLLLMLATLKTSGVAAPGTASWATSAFTPAQGSLIVALVAVRDTGGSGDIAANLTISDGTNSYTARVTQGMAGGAKMQGRIWTAPESAGVSRTITFDCGASNVSAAWWFIYEITGHDPNNPVGGSASDAATFPIDGAASLTLSSTPNPASVVLAIAGLDGDVSGTIAVTPGVGWTENGEVGNTTVQGYAQAQQRLASSSASVDWVDVRAGTMATFSGVGMALEIQSGLFGGLFQRVDKPQTILRCRPLGPGNPLREVKYYDVPAAPSAGITIVTDVGSLVLDGFSPTLGLLVTIAPNLGQLDLTGFAAQFPTSILPGSGNLALTGFGPTIGLPRTIVPGFGQLTLTGNSPTFPRTIVPATGSLTLTGFAPQFARTILPGFGGLVLDGFSPSFSFVTGGFTAQPGLGALTLTGFGPTIGLPRTLQPGLGALVLSGNAPAIGLPITVRPALGQLTLSGFGPAISFTQPGIFVTPGTGQLTLTGYAPMIGTFTFRITGGPVMVATLSGGGVLVASLTGGPTFTGTMSGGPV